MTDEVKTEEKSKTESVPLKQTAKSRTMRSEHKRVKKAFEPSSQLFQALIQNALDAIVVISPELTIRYESPSMEHLTGRKANSRTGKNPLEFCHPDDTEKVTNEFIKLLENKIPHVNIEIRLQHKDGRWLILELVGTNLIDDPVVNGIVLNLRDITERKKMDESLRQSEEQYRTLVETMNDGLSIVDTKNVITYVNDRLCEMTGYSREELMGHPVLKLIAGASQDKYSKEIRKRRKGIRSAYEMELLKKDGSRLIVNVSPQIIADSEGNMVGSFGVTTDITRQKEVEEKLLKSELNLRHAQAMVHLGYWEWDSWTNEVVLSEEMQRIFGYYQSKAKFSGRPEIIHPDDIVKLQEAIAESQRGGNPRVEVRLVLPTGDTKWIQAGATHIDTDSTNGGKVFGYALDITERKQMEEALKDSEETLKQAQRLAKVGSWTWNLIDNSLELSDEMRHLYGIEKREISSLENILSKFIHPDDRETVFEAAGRVISEGYGKPLVYRIIKPDGEVRWMSATIPKVRHCDVNGNPQVMVGAVQDINEQKQAQEALRESQEKLRTVFDSIGDGITVLDLAGNIIDVNETVLRIKGYNREDVIGRFGLDFVAEKDHARATAEMMGLFSGEVQHTPATELALLGKGGSEIPCEASASLLRDGDGNVVGLISVERDLRERKQAEHRLKESEERLRAFMESATDSFALWDSELNLVEINEAGINSFPPGTKKEEVIGKNLQQMVSTGRIEKYLEVIKTGKPLAIEDAITSPKFGSKHMDVRAFKVGEGLGIIVRDVTDRRHAEEELRHYSERLRAMTKQLSEVEESQRRRTARDLHDNVGQNLTALGINWSMAKMQLEKSRVEEVKTILDDSQELVEQTTEAIRDIMADLRPPVLEDYGLLAALRWYGDRFASRTGIVTTVQGEEPDTRMSTDIEITLFRIAQEALTNIAKHANASNVTVNFDKKDGRQRLLIADDGIGFDTDELSKYAGQANWGLVTMSERADSIGASFEIESTSGLGTRVIVEKLLSC
jgi:PAS domain S-box-containing protein